MEIPVALARTYRTQGSHHRYCIVEWQLLADQGTAHMKSKDGWLGIRSGMGNHTEWAARCVSCGRCAAVQAAYEVLAH